MYGFRTADAALNLLRALTTRAPVACTPRRLVWWLNKARLFHYQRIGFESRGAPLLIVYSPIGRPTILDLYPEHSFVDWMRRRGFDVFLLDWGNPGSEDRSLGLSGYALEYLPCAVRTVKRLTGSTKCSMLGWSVGGVFATIYAALFPEDLSNLILVTAPLDFRRRVPLPSSTGERAFALQNTLNSGNVPGEMIALGTIATDPYHAAIRPYLQLWQNFTDPAFLQHWHAMRTWATDLVPVTGALFHDLVVDLYEKNRLMRNELMLDGHNVDLGRIRARLLNIIAVDDRITPPRQSERLLEVVGSREKQNLRVPGTHVECMAGIRAPYQTWPKIYDWLAERNTRPATGRVIRFPAR